MKTLRLHRTVLFVFFLVTGFFQMAVGQDFSFTIQPSSLTLLQGQSASFVISLTPLDGFTNQVTLSVTNLPAAVTASFAPPQVTPPGTSVLTLTATTNATQGAFTLQLMAVGGGITNTASGSVTVSFGLLPICYGAIEGTITDAETGLPLGGAPVCTSGSYTTADTNGFYIFTNLTLAGADNLPVQYGVFASQTGYWPASGVAYAICSNTNTLNIVLQKQVPGSITGTIKTEGGQPLTNVSITASSASTFYATSDSTGAFQFPTLPVNDNNTAAYYSLQATPNGYWMVSSNTIVNSGSNSVVNLVAIPICYVTLTGSAVYGDTGLPVTNAPVEISTYGGISATTDANGDFSVTNLTLGFDNNPVTATVSVSPPGPNYYSGYTTLALGGCGSTNMAPAVKLAPVPPPPPNNYGAITGHVYDVETRLPITNAFVEALYGYFMQTDTNGAYSLTNVLVGMGTTTNQAYTVEASATGYYLVYSNVTVYAGETSTLDLYLLLMGYGYVEGTVLNASTGLPVSGVYLSIGTAGTTGADGHYFSGPLQLDNNNSPTYESFYATETGYWPSYTNTTITNGITNIVNIEFIQVCTGATIVGNVVNALTQGPITNATISVNGSYYQSVMTDTNGNFIITNITVGNDNSPIQTTLTASAPGFNPQSKTLTIFCDATINTEFGAPETVFGAIDGFVTNAVTGAPLTNVFIGSSFGGATTTDSNGFYILNQAPLGANGASRTWTVTAIPNGFPPQTKSTLVSANTTNQVDFGFGQPPTELVVSATGTPNPVMVGSNLLYTVTLTNEAADAANVVLADALPPSVTFVSASVTNDTGGAFSVPVLSNGIVSITASNFASNSVVVLLVTVTPTVAGMVTNVATVTSDTPDVNPSGTNHTATVITTVVSPPLFADIGVSMSGLPNPVLASNQLTYSLIVSNSGPTNAPAVVLTDSLPANVTFSSATVSQGTYAIIPGGVQWNIGTLIDKGSVSATIVILPLATGEVTNFATVSIGPSTPPVTDTNLANNSTNVITAVTAAVLTNITIQAGPITFNPQTGLFEQSVQVNNLGGVAAAAVRVTVLDMPASVELYNARGTTNGLPYVEYDQPVAPEGNVVFVLEYYEASRDVFAVTNFAATVVAAVQVPPATGTLLQLDRMPFMSQAGVLTIEFATVPGHTYAVEYSSDMQTWQTVAPPVVATNTETQWSDSGPPETASPPGNPGARFYRIVQTH